MGSPSFGIVWSQNHWATYFVKTTLNQVLIASLKIDQKPTRFENGKVVETKHNPTKTPYIVFDEHRDSPIGFGVKVAGKTTYIIQKKIHGKVIKVKVGNLYDYNLAGPRTEHSVGARTKAKEIIQELLITGKNPNNTLKEKALIKSLVDITLGECFEKFLKDRLSQAQPIKENTVKDINKSARKLGAWSQRKVLSLSTEEIIDRFNEIKSRHPTTAEQVFQWAHSAVKHVIKVEVFEAGRTRRIPAFTFNPFDILRMKKLYRTRDQLRESYEVKGIRKPLSTGDSLGSFLNALWERRKENRTGCDYMLCSLLFGTRKTEAAALQWRENLTEVESITTSWVDLNNRKVFFKTKSGKLSLPLTDAAYEILRQRHEMINELTPKAAKWVFPARSKFSKTGHYTDSRSLLEYICKDAQIPRRASHDFRRTFATVAESLCTMLMLKRLLGHSLGDDATNRYPDMEAKLSENLQRVELHILRNSPAVYNALLTPKYPPIEK
jgi:integrase